MRIHYQPSPYLLSHRNRTLSTIDTIVIHRLGREIPGYRTPRDISDVAAIFGDPALGTGGKLPYSFLYVPESETLYQGLPLTRVGLHARVWNRRSVGIAVLRDLQKYPLTDEQRLSLLCYVGLIRRYLEEKNLAKVSVLGHDECEGGSSDPNKKCPGETLNMKDFRQDLDRIYGSFFHAESSLRMLGANLDVV